MLTYGRSKIYIDDEINLKNLPNIITKAMQTHRQNAIEEDYLINFYLGKQDILNRPEGVSSTVNEKVVLNYAEEAVRNILGYTYGKPAQYTQRKTEYRDDIQKLSDILDYENSYAIDLDCQEFVSICGLGYEITLPKGSYDSTPEIPIKIGNLDPRRTFYVYNSKIGNNIALTCTYSDFKTSKDPYRIYYAFTDTTAYIYKVKGNGGTVVQPNNFVEAYNHLMGGNPITVYENNQFLTGDFEKAITVLNAINIIGSDSVNDIQNFVRSILVFVNSEVDKETIKSIKENRVIMLKGGQGINADAKYIYDNISVENVKEAKEMLLDSFYSTTGIPTKGSSISGGDTGMATEYKEGWVQLEIVAKNKEIYFKKSKKQQLSVILHLLKRKALINVELGVYDIKIDLPRNKNDNIQTKTQAFAVLHGTQGLDIKDSLEAVDLFTDVNEVAKRGELYWKNKTETKETEVVVDEE